MGCWLFSEKTYWRTELSMGNGGRDWEEKRRGRENWVRLVKTEKIQRTMLNLRTIVWSVLCCCNNINDASILEWKDKITVSFIYFTILMDKDHCPSTCLALLSSWWSVSYIPACMNAVGYSWKEAVPLTQHCSPEVYSHSVSPTSTHSTGDIILSHFFWWGTTS